MSEEEVVETSAMTAGTAALRRAPGVVVVGFEPVISYGGPRGTTPLVDTSRTRLTKTQLYDILDGLQPSEAVVFLGRVEIR